MLKRVLDSVPNVMMDEMCSRSLCSKSLCIGAVDT